MRRIRAPRLLFSSRCKLGRPIGSSQSLIADMLAKEPLTSPKPIAKVRQMHLLRQHGRHPRLVTAVQTFRSTESVIETMAGRIIRRDAGFN